VLSHIGVKLENVEAILDLTIHGERMCLGLRMPKDSDFVFHVGRNDVMPLLLEFINSVDGSLRLGMRLSWLRLVCSNGLVMRELLSGFSKLHVGSDIVSELDNHLIQAFKSIEENRRPIARWMETTVDEEAIRNWSDGPVRNTWGVKAAVRAYHIALRGIDVDIQRMVRSTSVAEIPVIDKRAVPGARSTGDPLNLFHASQTLTWLAGERGEVQEQLDWKSQVQEMITELERGGI
jgi:hypothetical protein